MIELYKRLVMPCKSANQINQVHITLENRITPLEFRELEDTYPPDCKWKVDLHEDIHNQKNNTALTMRWKFRKNKALSEEARIRHSKQWVSTLSKLSSHCKKQEIENFSRHRVLRDLWFYSNGEDRSKKALLICFTGNSRRMMMPVTTLLQQLDAQKVDMALLSDPSRSGYRNGMLGVGGTLDLVFDSLPELLRLNDYQSAVSMGTSAGGLPAVLAALRLHLDATMSVGGTSPDDPRWTAHDGTGARDIIKRYSEGIDHFPATYLMFGADFEKDKKEAEQLAEIVPAQLLSVSDKSGTVGHNALLPLLNRGEMISMLENTIFSV